MEPQVFEVLSLLVENHERVVTKEEILDAVWPQRYVTEAALNSRIMSARKALGDDGRTQSYIKTVHGRGYRFVETVVQRPAAARAFAVDVEEPVGAPSPRSLPATRQGALPIPATPFVGREHELARLRDLLGRPDARLVSIVGPGGIGKTRLAIEAVASAARPECPLTYVSLQAASDARAAAFAMAAALGVPLVDADHCEQIIEALRGQRRLLVLDNLEHLVDAVGPYISRVLEAAPEIRIVLTSRSVLALAEEWTFRIDGLDHDGPDAAAARLFRQRASQVRAEETDVSFDAAAVTQLGVLLGGMPLAIELAASLSRYHSVTDLVELVSRQSSALATDIRNVPERHRSLSALFGEAFSTLSTDQQGAMEALSVFDTNFSAEAASAVARADLRTLWSLVDRSLVHASDGRFHLHPSLRQYSAERCAGCDERGQTAHAEYFAAFLAQRDDQLKSGGQIEAMSQIDADYDNVVRAWRWAAAHGRVDLIAAGAYSSSRHLTFRARFFEADELAQSPSPQLSARAKSTGRCSVAS
jgi:predicted ATPase/DNA-binding winged helix-turn-helix (wHTH) protein